MTWKELVQLVDNMSEEQKNTDVTFFDNRNEFFGVQSLEFTGDFDDILDANHPFLTTL